MAGEFDALWSRHGSVIESCARKVAPALHPSERAALVQDGRIWLWEQTGMIQRWESSRTAAGVTAGIRSMVTRRMLDAQRNERTQASRGGMTGRVSA